MSPPPLPNSRTFSPPQNVTIGFNLSIPRGVHVRSHLGARLSSATSFSEALRYAISDTAPDIRHLGDKAAGKDLGQVLRGWTAGSS